MALNSKATESNIKSKTLHRPGFATVFSVAPWLVSVSLWIGLTGCAGTPPSKNPTSGKKTTAVKVDSGARDLEALRGGLKTKEDSLVLDLLQGFRTLRLQGDSEGADADAVGRGRRAYDELEARLRKGGLKSKVGGERVYSIGDQDNLTLLDVLTVASKSAQKLLLEGDMEKAKARNRDIVLNRAALSFAVEDAIWGLALADALESTILPEPTKRKLKTLHESYVHDATQDEIVREVNGLLAEVSEEKLRQQLKKLANRAWERDRRANRLPQGAKKAAVQDTVPPPPVAPAASKDVNAATPTAGQPDTTIRAASVGNAQHAQIDSLIGAGKYIPALHALESLDAAGHADFIRDRRQKAGERFCDDRRRTAADFYKRARAASVDSVKGQLLRKTAADLDSCLFYFPETSVGAKVKRNREMIDAELKKLPK